MFAFSDVKDGMIREFNVEIKMDDGIILRADIFRPNDNEKHPVILTYGPYGKGLAFQDGYKEAWASMVQNHPDIPYGSSNLYQSWELCDPEKFVPDGYVCLRIDSRGCGCSEGYIDLFSARETADLYACIEWAGVQPWSNGKVGMCGISYYSQNAWLIAEKNPPHLAAIVIWEGCGDMYRDATHQGGIQSEFFPDWYRNQIVSVQYGRGDRGFKSRVTGENVSGNVNLTEKELENNRYNIEDTLTAHPMCDEYYDSMVCNYEKIKVPLLSAANWGGIGLHTRGNFEGFMRAGSELKWLETHGDEHWTSFYTDYGVNLQKKFLGYFLKGEDNGWMDTPRVLLNVRHPGEKFVFRAENEWPLARTKWTKYYLNMDYTLTDYPKKETGTMTYEAMGDGLTFLTDPFVEEVELCGPMASKMTISSDTIDADMFLALRLFNANMKEITFIGSNDPHTPISLGWLRASHRKLDEKRSKFYMPYHTHDEYQPLEPGKKYDLDIEVLPTSIVIPKGYRLALTVRGKDYETAAAVTPYGSQNFSGVGPHRHTNAINRPPAIFANNVTIHFDEDKKPYILLPIIPK